PWTSGSVKGDADTWRHYAKTARRATRDARNLMNVRYEDLVSEPERTLRGVCQFLNLPYTAEMMDFPSKASNVNAEREPWKKNVMKPVSVDSLDAWKNELTPASVAQAEA